LDVRSMIIGDTKEVVTKHYTHEDIGMKLKALNKYSQAMKAENKLNGIDSMTAIVNN